VIIYGCAGGLWGKIKTEYFWVLTRKPLDPKNSKEDAEEYNRIQENIKKVYKTNF